MIADPSMTNRSSAEKIAQATQGFLDKQTSPVTKLVESFENTSRLVYDPATSRFETGSKEYLESQCFVYDGALAAIAYSLLREFERAKDILSIFEWNFHYAKGDHIGLFNAYRTDAHADASRLLSMGIDGDRMHAGPNIWVGLAAYQYTMLSGDIQLFPLCLEMIKWVIHRIPHYSPLDGVRGGIAMGSGWGPNWKEIYSTEHNIDYFALLNIVASCFKNPDLEGMIKASALRFEEICEEQTATLSWLLRRVFDKTEHRFNTGINEAGIDRVRALDTTSFAILGIGPRCLMDNEVDPIRLIEGVEKHLQVSVNVENEIITGFDFTDAEGHGGNRPPVIWIEGTYQMVLAYQEMANFYHSEGNKTNEAYWRRKAEFLAKQTERLTDLLSSDQQIPPYTSARPKSTEIMTTFKENWEIQRTDSSLAVKSVASAVWRFLAASRFNPMSAIRAPQSFPRERSL